MKESKKKNTFILVLKKIKKRVKLRMILLLALTFTFGTYSWFIYSTRVESGISARIRSWKVNFAVGDNEFTQFIEMNVDEIYPGMQDYVQTIRAFNDGDNAAILSYEITSVTILGVTYVTDATTSSENLQNQLEHNYPFSLVMSQNQVVIPTDSQSEFTVRVTWPYETGNDELDTEWGNRAYEYADSGNQGSMIQIQIKISAIQQNVETAP